MTLPPIDLTQLHFLRPWWLLALLLVPALAWWRRGRGRERHAWQDAVDAHLLPHLLEGAGNAVRRSRPWAAALGLAGLVLAILAMAGPSWRKSEMPLWQTRTPLVVALDLSTRTLANDLPPSRLPQARAKIAQLLKARDGGQLALVAWAADAYTVAPLTDDAANLALFLDALAPDVMPEDGHDAARAIAWSRQLLRQAGFDRGDILLLTDSADAGAAQAAASARAAGYRVSVLGLGSPRGGTFALPTGGSGMARLDAASLRAVASAGGGRYAPLAPGDGDLRALQLLQADAADMTGARGQTVAAWQDDGVWLLPLALLLLLPLFRRGGALLVLGMVLLAPSWQLQAQAGAQAPQATAFRRADQVAHERISDGVDAYRRQQYEQAAQAFAGIDTAEGQYNLGNALAQQRQYDAAIAAYDRALQLQPGMEDALANREIVQRQRKQQPPPNQQQQQQQQNQDQQGQQNQQQQPQQQGGQQPSQQQGDGQPPPPSQTQQPPQRSGEGAQPQPQPQAGDPQQQAQADAAQRARMDDALRRQGGEQAQGQPQRPDETPADRERRLANEALLRRVPDDPGGLLRAKFRLEHERRRGGGR